MLLCVDIGNTNVKFALYKDNKELGCFFYIHTDSKKTIYEYDIIINYFLSNNGFSLDDINTIAISSVVPVVGENISLWVESRGKNLLWISYKLLSEVVVDRNIEVQIGADLFCNAVASWELFGDSSIIISLGTALTFTVLQRNEIKGVIISPGLGTSRESLTHNAAQLFSVDLQIPSKVIGNDTKTAMQSGLMYGYAGMIDSFIRRISEELNLVKSPHVVLTGGECGLLKPILGYDTVIEPYLTIKGIRKLVELNS